MSSRFVKLIIRDAYDPKFKPSISRIDPQGRVTIEFGKSITVPKSFSALNNVALTFALKRKSATSKDNRILATEQSLY